MEVLEIHRRRNQVDVAAQEGSGEAHAQVYAVAAGGINRMVDGVIEVGRRDGGGADTIQRVRPVHSAEIEVLEIVIGGGCQRFHVGDIVAEGQAEAREVTAQRIAGGKGDPVAVLDVIQQVLRTQALV